MKNTIEKALHAAYHFGRDNGSLKSEKNYNDFVSTSTAKKSLEVLEVAEHQLMIIKKLIESKPIRNLDESLAWYEEVLNKEK